MNKNEQKSTIIKTQLQEMHNESKNNNEILYKENQGVAYITFNRPKQQNAFKLGMFQIFIDLLLKADSSSTVKAIVLQGNGKSFTSGNDLNNFLAFDFQDDQELKLLALKEISNISYTLTQTLITLKKPIIAAVKGNAIGFGYTMLPLCDLIFCTKTSNFEAPLVRLAQGPEMCSSLTFPNIFGKTLAFNILVNSQKLSGFDMEKLNFANKAFDTEKEMDEYIDGVVKNLCDMDQESIIEAKKLININFKKYLEIANKRESTNLINRWASDNLQTTIMKFFQNKAKL